MMLHEDRPNTLRTIYIPQIERNTVGWLAGKNRKFSGAGVALQAWLPETPTARRFINAKKHVCVRNSLIGDGRLVRTSRGMSVRRSLLTLV